MATISRRLRWLGWGAFTLLGLLIGGPFLLPLPALEDTVPPRELAQADDRFTVVEGIEVRYRDLGGGGSTFVLFHGFGANALSWEPVVEDLTALGRVIAFDRVGFGLTERPLSWEGEHPYATVSQADLALGLMDALAVDTATLVGHSAGASVATIIALEHPERVSGLILESPTLDSRPGAITSFLLGTPQGQRVARFAARRGAQRMNELLASAYHDPARITDETLDGYRQPLRAKNWDTGLARYTAAPRVRGIEARLPDLTVPLLIVTGDDDTWVPTEDTIALAESVPAADLAVLEACGHVAHEECPDRFAEIVRDWMAGQR
jgi:pimeloyl-ACP methyl ester carboxylesterase